MGGLPKHLTHHSLENWLQSEEFAGNQRVNQQLREGNAGAVEANVMPLIFYKCSKACNDEESIVNKIKDS